MLIEKYNVNLLYIYDDLFCNTKQELVDFCARIKPYGLKWGVSLRVDKVDGETLAMMKESGCFMIGYGAESASEEVLKSMKKSIKLHQIEKAFSLTRENKIGIGGNFIFGDPAETSDTAFFTLEWWKKHYYYHVNLAYITPFPGSEDFNYCVREGIIKDKLKYMEDGCPIVNMSKMADDDFTELRLLSREYTESYRMFAEIKSLDVYRYDEIRKENSYQFEIVCPSCGKEGSYKNFIMNYFSVDGVEINNLFGFTVVCKHCYQKFDMSPIDFPHVQQKLLTAQEKVASKLAHILSINAPVSITPYVPKSVFGRLDNILNLKAFNIKNFLDRNKTSQKQYDFSNYPILKRDRQTIEESCRDNYILVLPSLNNRRIIKHLIEECGVDSDKIVGGF